jgi:hypothetical protein
MTKHPHFQQHVDTAISDADAPLDGLTAVALVYDIFAAASRNMLEGNAAEDPTTAHEKLHWAILFLRARQAGDRKAYDRALRHFPSLHDLPLTQDDTALTDLIATLARKSITDQLKEIAEDPNINEMKKLARKEGLRRKAAAWATTRRTSKALAILDSTGLPAASPHEGTRLLRQHWGPVFKSKPHSVSEMSFYDAYIQKAPSDIDWHMDFEEFRSLLMAMDDSAPGPDGLPYSALQHAPASIHLFLYKCYEDIIAGKAVPNNFNESYLTFLPKGEVDADAFHTARTPDTTRPLNLSNTIAKLIAAAINRPLAAMAARTVVGQQRGLHEGQVPHRQCT